MLLTEDRLPSRQERLPGLRARSRRYMQVFPLLAVPTSQPHAICDRLHRISVRNGLSA